MREAAGQGPSMFSARWTYFFQYILKIHYSRSLEMREAGLALKFGFGCWEILENQRASPHLVQWISAINFGMNWTVLITAQRARQQICHCCLVFVLV